MPSKRNGTKPPWWDIYKVPELRAGKHGHIQLKKFTVSKYEAEHYNMMQMFSFCFGRGIRPGNYIKLLDWKLGELWMSDTPAEISDLFGLFHAVGERDEPTVLMHGLGLGVALKGCMTKGASHITVVERDPDVIALVGRQWQKVYGDRLTIIEGDALEMKWPKGSHWDVVWHDVWPTISLENVDTMSRLHRRFGSRAGWQSSWCRGRVQKMQREDRIQHLYF